MKEGLFYKIKDKHLCMYGINSKEIHLNSNTSIEILKIKEIKYTYQPILKIVFKMDSKKYKIKTVESYLNEMFMEDKYMNRILKMREINKK